MKYFKKNLKIIILILVCILVYIIYKDSPKRNITYLTLGDGYSIGINSYGKKDYGYNNYIKDYLDKENRLYKYYEEYSSEEMMIKDLYNQIVNGSGRKKNIKQVLRETDIITLSIGLNDLIYKESLSNKLLSKSNDDIVSEIIIDLDILIDEIKKYSQADIYIVEYYNSYKDDDRTKGMLDSLNIKYQDYAKSNSLKYISITRNLDKYFENPNSNYPNSLGYGEISKDIISAIDLTNN